MFNTDKQSAAINKLQLAVTPLQAETHNVQ